jgi:site-specific DNA recombinase
MTVAGIYGRESRGKRKSVADQLELGQQVCAAEGWEARVYSDRRGASRYSTGTRGGWGALMADLVAGLLHILVIWESSRGSRKNTEWSGLLDICQRQGIKIYVISHERLYDPRNHRDWETLASDGVKSQSEVQLLSARVKRGVGMAVAAGRPPAGAPPYGYRRVYDPSTGELTGQEIDPETGPIAKEIIERASRGVPISEITRDLNERGIPAPGLRSHNVGTQWYRLRVRSIATSPAYAGLRRHRPLDAEGRRAAKGTDHAGTWPPLVDLATHRAAVKVLTGRKSSGTSNARPGAQVHLLSWLAECYKGHPITPRREAYRCAPGCVTLGPRDAVDSHVTDVILGVLETPEWYRHLRQASEVTSAEVRAAEDELERLEGELEDWRKSTYDGRGTSPATMAAVEAGLQPRIEAARRRTQDTGLPDALQPFTEPGADVRARWDAATLAARRDVIRAMATVTIHPGRGKALEERVDVLPALSKTLPS